MILVLYPTELSTPHRESATSIAAPAIRGTVWPSATAPLEEPLADPPGPVDPLVPEVEPDDAGAAAEATTVLFPLEVGIALLSSALLASMVAKPTDGGEKR